MAVIIVKSLPRHVREINWIGSDAIKSYRIGHAIKLFDRDVTLSNNLNHINLSIFEQHSQGFASQRAITITNLPIKTP